ncbi:MAG: histidine phosphatase family protein [Defluviitaleaceae bacterium]|nr:histidine phosphatase family protein [Defluviitaleaceae bacterium]
MKIFTVRHGQTAWNLQRRLQGHSDIPLDEVGLAQAQALSARFKDVSIDAIYSSDMSRTFETARAINAHHGVEITTSPALREMNLGIYEGMVIDEIADQIDWLHPDGGESREAAHARIHAYLDEIIAKGHGTAVVVGHHGTSRASIAYFTESNLNSLVGNTAVHCYEFAADGKWTMTLENCTTHLDE